MWQAIAANRRRSILIVVLMGVILVTLGGCIGIFIGSQFASLDVRGNGDEAATGGLTGAAVALAIWLVLWIVAVFRGDRVLLRSAHAREIQKRDAPQLWNVVEEMTIAAGLRHMPRVYLVEDSTPNAFAVGRKPETASVAVTSGLLRLLNRDELQGVVAHEIAHIRNLDIRFMTIAAVLVASVEVLSHIFLRTGPYAAAGRRSGGSSRSGGQGYLLAVALVVAILTPILVRLLYLATSRWREYLADASAARFTRFPDGLASALEKIAVHQSGASGGNHSGALAALYIVNPVEKLSASSLFSTHPPTDRRVKILRGMGGRAGYVDYEAALRKIEGRKLRLAALEAAGRSEASLAARPPSAEPESHHAAVDRAREVADLLDRFANYLILPCACGLRIKAPPDFKRESVLCPRCGRLNQLPKAETIPASGASGEPESEKVPTATGNGGRLRYHRRGEQWESFRCACGQTIQLGPGYPLDYTVCVNCNRRIELTGAASHA